MQHDQVKLKISQSYQVFIFTKNELKLNKVLTTEVPAKAHKIGDPQNNYEW